MLFRARMLSFQTVVFVISAIFAGCTPTTPQISGRVVDCFGNALGGVTVRVVNSRWSVQSDEAGRYSIDFAPGSFAVEYACNACTTITMNLNLVTPKDYPAQDVVLYPIPTEPGIYLIGHDALIALEGTALSSRNYSTGHGLNVVHHEDIIVPTRRNVSTEPGVLRFIDTAPDPVLLTPIQSWGVLARKARELLQPTGPQEFTPLLDTATEIGTEKLLVRTIELEVGDYAWVPVSDRGFGGMYPIIGNSAYRFNVGAGGELVRSVLKRLDLSKYAPANPLGLRAHASVSIPLFIAGMQEQVDVHADLAWKDGRWELAAITNLADAGPEYYAIRSAQTERYLPAALLTLSEDLAGSTRSDELLLLASMLCLLGIPNPGTVDAHDALLMLSMIEAPATQSAGRVILDLVCKDRDWKDVSNMIDRALPQDIATPAETLKDISKFSEFCVDIGLQKPLPILFQAAAALFESVPPEQKDTLLPAHLLLSCRANEPLPRPDPEAVLVAQGPNLPWVYAWAYFENGDRASLETLRQDFEALRDRKLVGGGNDAQRQMAIDVGLVPTLVFLESYDTANEIVRRILDKGDKQEAELVVWIHAHALLDKGENERVAQIAYDLMDGHLGNIDWDMVTSILMWLADKQDAERVHKLEMSLSLHLRGISLSEEFANGCRATAAIYATMAMVEWKLGQPDGARSILANASSCIDVLLQDCAENNPLVPRSALMTHARAAAVLGDYNQAVRLLRCDDKLDPSEYRYLIGPILSAPTETWPDVAKKLTAALRMHMSGPAT